MRRLALLTLLLAAGLLLLGCPSRRNPDPIAVDARHVAYAVATWPDASREQLELGQTLTLDRCDRCHGHARPDQVRLKHWPKVAERMAGRSRLDEAGEEAVVRYLLAVAQVHAQPAGPIE